MENNTLIIFKSDIQAQLNLIKRIGDQLNQRTDSAKWHSLLLQRMSQEIEGIRPAILSEETYFLLNSLRGFRHFFRHAYGTPLDYEQLKPNLAKAMRLFSLLEADVNQFIQKLSQS